MVVGICYDWFCLGIEVKGESVSKSCCDFIFYDISI